MTDCVILQVYLDHGMNKSAGPFLDTSDDLRPSIARATIIWIIG